LPFGFIVILLLSWKDTTAQAESVFSCRDWLRGPDGANAQHMGCGRTAGSAFPARVLSGRQVQSVREPAANPIEKIYWEDVFEIRYSSNRLCWRQQKRGGHRHCISAIGPVL